MRQQQREAMEAFAPDWLRIARGPFHKSTPLFPASATFAALGLAVRSLED